MIIIIIIYIFLIKQLLSYNIISGRKDIKLCINCKYFIDNNPNKELGHCGKFVSINKITGEKIFYPVIFRRQFPEYCGKEGKEYIDKNINEIHKQINNDSTDSIKLCMNCKYFFKDNSNINYGKCKKFKNKYYTNDFFQLACTVREDNYLCGENGKNYEENIK